VRPFPSVALYTIACVPGTMYQASMALAVVVAPPSTDALMPRLRSSEGPVMVAQVGVGVADIYSGWVVAVQADGRRYRIRCSVPVPVPRKCYPRRLRLKCLYLMSSYHLRRGSRAGDQRIKLCFGETGLVALSSATQSFFRCDSSLLTMRDPDGIGEEFLHNCDFCNDLSYTNFVIAHLHRMRRSRNSRRRWRPSLSGPSHPCRMPPMERSEPGWSARVPYRGKWKKRPVCRHLRFDLQGRCCTHFRH